MSESDYPDYNSWMENNSSSTRKQSQPNGVSESENDWGHRSNMAKQGEKDYEEKKSVSQNLNERKHGEVVQMKKKNHGKCGGDASNKNSDKLVDEGKSTKQKYADKYGN